MKFTLPTLQYNYDAMEPYLDTKTMEIHYTKHHQTYINNTNEVLKKLPELENLNINELIREIKNIKNNKQEILRNNAGGHINHTMFWTSLKKGTFLKGNIKNAIEQNFGDIIKFKELFEKIALNRFGSGWAWLIKKENRLCINSTANQDNPLMGKDITGVDGYPLMGLDLWEHAYYLKYQNRRADYIKSFWNILNWDEIERRFNQET